MSRLDELIQEYCPNGGHYYELGEIAHYAKERIDASEVDENNYVGVENLLQNKMGKTVATSVPTSGAVIAFHPGDILIGNIRPYLRKIWLADCDGGTNGDVLTLQINSTAMLIPKYLYYVISSEQFFLYDIQNSKGAKMPRGSKDAVLKYSVPVPPLPVQSEIVRILDNFTELTAELTEELTARKKQYGYYRDKLLSFDEAQIPVVELRSIVKRSCSGATPAKGNSEYYSNGTIPWIRTQDVRFNEITEVDSYITEKAVEEIAVKWIPENCVIVAISGATAGRCAINKIKATTNQHCLNLEIDEAKALYKYIYYCIYSKYDDLISRKQGARGDLNSSLVLSLEIPLPALDVQKRLVHVLDNFDAICSDLNIGLPAEIEARQKQYEFYRDALLTYAATGKIISNRAEQNRIEQNRTEQNRTDEYNALIRLCQYVFGVVYMELGQIAEITDYVANGSFASLKENVIYKNEPDYAALIRTTDYSSNFNPGKMVYIDEHAYEFLSKSKLFGGEIIINNIGAGVGTTFRCPFLNIRMSLAPNAVMVKTDNDPFYYFWFRSKWGQDAIRKIVGKSAMPKFNKTGLRSIIVPVPTKETQDKIVAILERFEALCEDISFGLPAEIEARTKQYEYYRDKLLTFQKKI